MSRAIRIACLVAAALILLGAILSGAALLFGARFSQLWTNQIYTGIPWLSFGGGFGGYRNWENAYAQDGHYSVSAEGLQGIDLRWISGDAQVVVTDGDTVRFSESASQSLSEATALRWGMENGTLYIQYCPPVAAMRLPGKSLTLELPRALADDLEQFSFDGSSADLTVSDLQTQRFQFDSASGRLNAAPIIARQVRLDSSSGDLAFSGAYESLQADTASGTVRVESLGAAQRTGVNSSSGGIRLSGDCGELSLDTASGSIRAEGPVSASRLRAGSSSGDMDLYGAFQWVSVDTTSGDISLRSSVCPGTLSVDTTSGRVTLCLPADSGFTLDFDSSSGKLDCQLPLTMQKDQLICGDGQARFQVSTTSGGLYIQADE